MPLTVAVAMSGGVDSSTAAALLTENKTDCVSGGSPDVVGLTMQLWNQRRLARLQGLEEGVTSAGGASGRCCSLDDAYDARRVADFLGIPFYVVNFEERFEADVVRPFVETYLAGETPIPCSRCNTEIKFERLIQTARQVGAERVATGHYARVDRDDAGRFRLRAGVDRSKDQSYFLFGLTQEQLSRALFPLGEMTKEQVRSTARTKNLPVAEKADSQEICFVPTGRYDDFIEAYLLEQGRKANTPPGGEIVSTDGTVLGEHHGLHHYTIGQRKGLGIALGKPLYVVEIEGQQNRVVVGPNEELFRKRFLVRDVNWIRPVTVGESIEASVKIRNQHSPAEARVEVRTLREASVEFFAPQRAITPGQAAAFYAGDEVLGGGWISRLL